MAVTSFTHPVFWKVIQQKRDSKAMSRKELGQLIGKDEHFVERLEQGKVVRTLAYELQKKISVHLELDLSELHRCVEEEQLGRAQERLHLRF